MGANGWWCMTVLRIGDPGFPFMSWFRQAWQNRSDQEDPNNSPRNTRWPYWTPRVYYPTRENYPYGYPLRHGFVIPADTPGIKELYTLGDWNLQTTYYQGKYPFTQTDTPTLVPPEPGDGWLIERTVDPAPPTDRYIVKYEYTTTPLTDPHLLRMFARGFEDIRNHLILRPPVAPGPKYYAGISPDSQLPAGTMYPFWLVKGATSGITRRTQSTKAAHLISVTYYRTRIDADTKDYAYGGNYSWNGTSWDFIPERPLPVTSFYPAPYEVSQKTCAKIYYSVTLDPDGLVESATMVPYGAPWFSHGIGGMCYPLSIRNIRGPINQEYYISGSDHWKTWTKSVILWRPLGTTRWWTGHSRYTPGTPQSQGALTKDGCDTLAVYYASRSAESFAKGGGTSDGWRVLAYHDTPSPSTLGTTSGAIDLTLVDPPAPGEAVWIAPYDVWFESKNGTITRSSPGVGKVLIVPGATVLPVSLPLAGGGILAGGIS